MDEIIEYPFVFYGNLLLIYQTAQNEFWVPMDALCSAFGLDSEAESNRAQANKSLFESIGMLPVTYKNDQEQMERRLTICLRLQAIPFWLCTLDPLKAKKPFDDALRLFQSNAKYDLWERNFPEIIQKGIKGIAPDELPLYFQDLLNLGKLNRSSKEHLKDQFGLRKILYASKLCGINWFAGDLPADDNEPFDAYLNTDPDAALRALELQELTKLSEGELRERSKKIKKPKWVERTTKSTITIGDLPDQEEGARRYIMPE